MLHGEQYLELHRPLPTEAKLTSKICVSDVVDKGKNAIIVIDGKCLCFSYLILYIYIYIVIHYFYFTYLLCRLQFYTLN